MVQPKVNARCSNCREYQNDMTPEEVQLVVCLRVPSRSFYAFDCHACLNRSTSLATPDIIEKLTMGTVKVEYEILPEEYFEPKSGPVINHDDILDFYTKSSETDKLSAIARTYLLNDIRP